MFHITQIIRKRVSNRRCYFFFQMNVYPFPHMHHELKPNGFLLDNYIGLCRSAISKICLFAHGNTSLLDTSESFELAIVYIISAV